MQIFSSSYTSQARMSRKIRRSVDIVRSGGTWPMSGVAELPAIKKQVPWEWDNKSLLLLLRTFYFGLYCLELLKDLPVEDLFNVCCSIICVVRLCAFYVQYYSFLPFCHEHQFGLNSRIAAPKFCTKSRFYFLRRNLFEQFAPTLPKSKIAWMEILFSAIWAKLKVLTISSWQFSQQFWNHHFSVFSTLCFTHLPWKSC